MKFPFSICLLFCLLAVFGQAKSTPANQVVLPILDSELDLLANFNWHVAEKSMQLSDIQNSQDWQPSYQSNQINEDKNLWGKVSLSFESPQDEPYFLTIGNPLLDYVDVFILDDKNRILDSYLMGSNRDYAKRPFQHRLFVTQINSLQDSVTVYIRINDDGPLAFPVNLQKQSTLIATEQFLLATIGFICGGLALLASYFLITYIYMRSPVRFWFSLSCATFLLLFLNTIGVLSQITGITAYLSNFSCALLGLLIITSAKVMFAILEKVPPLWRYALYSFGFITLALAFTPHSGQQITFATVIAASAIVLVALLCFFYHQKDKRKAHTIGLLALSCMVLAGFTQVILYLTGITVTQTISLLFAVLITISIMLVAMTIEAHERVLTKRRNLQQQAKINELQSYSDLFTDSVVGLYTSSLNGQLIRVNPAMCALFGYADESEMLKRVDNTDKFYADPQDRAIMLGEIHKNEKVLGKKILGIHKDNSHFWFSISCQIVQRQEQRFLYGSIVAATEVETNKNNPDEPNQPPESSYVDEATSLQKSVKGNKPKKGWMPQINLALQHDSFELHYQHYQALSQHAAGHHYEIFLRIKDSKGNLVKASTFLPDAEQHNLSAKIDRWVIEYYFSWLNNNPQHLEELSRVSINLSGDSLADQDLKLFVLNAFEKYQIPHQKVCFDIGESLAVMQMDETLEFIDTFQKLGCLIALDDFGMGASSFHNLKQLPVHQIKIDGNFIKDMLVEPINLVMVNSIKEVAKAMNIETVAEFVESTEIMVELGKMGIDFAQGNGVATPQALTEFTPHR